MKIITHLVYICASLYVCVRANALRLQLRGLARAECASKPLEAFDECIAFIHLETQMRLCKNAFPYAFKPIAHSERYVAIR